MANFIFAVRNHHLAGSGNPPAIIDEPGSSVFRSYFENEHGEQWIFVHDFKSGASTIRSGDCGWQRPLTIRSAAEVVELFEAKRRDLLEANAEPASIPLIDRVIHTWRAMEPGTPVLCSDQGPVTLNAAEQLWLRACLAVTK